VAKKNFVVKQARAGEVEAWKPDEPKSQDSDRVILWIEPDLANPTQVVHIYVLFGRMSIGGSKPISQQQLLA
jgi:hypothetical protein